MDAGYDRTLDGVFKWLHVFELCHYTRVFRLMICGRGATLSHTVIGLWRREVVHVWCPWFFGACAAVAFSSIFCGLRRGRATAIMNLDLTSA